MARKLTALVAVLALALLAVVPAFAAGPDFGAGLWADGQQWGTKATTGLPAPHGFDQSFDGFYFFVAPGWSAETDGMGGWLQAPVGSAAPGNPSYNGGRWATIKVTVLDQSILPLTSYAQIQEAASMGKVVVGAMPEWDGAHPWIYFQCPLLPFKG